MIIFWAVILHKKAGQAGQGVGALKRVGAGTPLRTMANVSREIPSALFCLVITFLSF